MSVLLIGSEGSMGKRYQAILKYLGKKFDCIDKGDEVPAVEYEGFIIATPTETHANFIRSLSKFKKPILVEKPISKDINEVRECIELIRDDNTPMSMMLQYCLLGRGFGSGDSSYNYFRHGNDGLYWDCLQIIGLSRGNVELREDSPIWECKLNGDWLNLADMDRAYIQFIKDWYVNPYQDMGLIYHAHAKTYQMARDA